jgi:hypothetical protein
MSVAHARPALRRAGVQPLARPNFRGPVANLPSMSSAPALVGPALPTPPASAPAPDSRPRAPHRLGSARWPRPRPPRWPARPHTHAGLGARGRRDRPRSAAAAGRGGRTTMPSTCVRRSIGGSSLQRVVPRDEPPMSSRSHPRNLPPPRVTNLASAAAQPRAQRLLWRSVPSRGACVPAMGASRAAASDPASRPRATARIGPTCREASEQRWGTLPREVGDDRQRPRAGATSPSRGGRSVRHQ